MKEQNNHSPNKIGRRLAAGVAVVALGTLAAAKMSDEPLKDKTGVESIQNTSELTATKLAKKIEDTLNSGQEYKGVNVLMGQYFSVNPEAQQGLGIETIYHPIKLDEKTVGYININQETGFVDVVEVDTNNGRLIENSENSYESDLIAEYGLLVQEIDGLGNVAMLNDKAGTFVGQTAPASEN